MRESSGQGKGDKGRETRETRDDGCGRQGTTGVGDKEARTCFQTSCYVP
ncbi:MAG: hypothetical protein ACHBN1_11050 [Heteroscytonema crispum UTEX LB 1556]